MSDTYDVKLKRGNKQEWVAIPIAFSPREAEQRALAVCTNKHGPGWKVIKVERRLPG